MTMAPILELIILMHFCAIVVAMANIPKFSSILVFGDSLVDTGNNNHINTLAKADHFPYGRDFPGHVATGRVSNGKLVPDFLVSILNLKDIVPPYLDPNLSDEQLLTGVSFASAGPGIDDLTAASFNVISMSQQVENFKDYVVKLQNIVGENQTKQILADSLVIFCVGANDFILNFFDLPNRIFPFTIDQYQDYLQDKLQVLIKDIYDLGCRKFGVGGLGPTGCIPYQMTIKFGPIRKCVDYENFYCQQYNQKLMKRLPQIQASLAGSKIVYTDLYYPVLNPLNQPEKYGIEVTNVGCCGSGLLEATPFCNVLSPVCNDPSKYVFWDAFHFSEATYKYLTNYIQTYVLPQFNV